jgi:hypothetical protein
LQTSASEMLTANDASGQFPASGTSELKMVMPLPQLWPYEHTQWATALPAEDKDCLVTHCTASKSTAYLIGAI